MKKIKNFQLFENEKASMVKTFTNNQFDSFCSAVSKWEKENGKTVKWCLYGSSNPGFGLTKEGAKRFWDSYVKSGKEFSLVEMGDVLYGILHSGKNIEMAFDNDDKKVDKSKLKDLI